MAFLEIRGLRSGYGNLPVLHDLTLEVNQGETAVVLGLNGAGKTTLMMTLAGILPAWEGKIVFDGEPITRLPAPKRVERGIALSPEGRRVFPGLSVANNLRMGAWVRRKRKAEVEEAMERVFGFFPRLQERRDQLAGTLSGGEQQMLAIARALMSAPKLLMIDEASLGLAPVIVQELFRIYGEIARSGVTVFLVEQNVGVLKVVDRAFIMEKGSIVYAGTREEIGDGAEIRRAYLGAA